MASGREPAKMDTFAHRASSIAVDGAKTCVEQMEQISLPQRRIVDRVVP